MRRQERFLEQRRKRLVPPVTQWRSRIWQITSWVRQPTLSEPYARLLLKTGVTRPAALSAGGSKHSFPLRSANSCSTTSCFAMRSAGPSSIADGVARTAGTAQHGPDRAVRGHSLRRHRLARAGSRPGLQPLIGARPAVSPALARAPRPGAAPGRGSCRPVPGSARLWRRRTGKGGGRGARVDERQCRSWLTGVDEPIASLGVAMPRKAVVPPAEVGVMAGQAVAVPWVMLTVPGVVSVVMHAVLWWLITIGSDIS